ncbi:hypothetical protein I3U63_22955 [Mycobacteroides abscessus subsp. massiliense]|uniref:hypothetical protein n=1 Tax=Mycobacteroides abscessus TaxID=36809 RepID=UPI0019D0DD9C|nr:hypothetical protein [Mycobacteroides abscessus]MBN7324376.1 hypothetical protein [Mycobacteroides abscessus subsp. massiliense]
MKTLELTWIEQVQRTKKVLVPDNYTPGEQWKLDEQLEALDDHGTRRALGRGEIHIRDASYDPDAEVLITDPADRHYTVAIYDTAHLTGAPVWQWTTPITLREALEAAVAQIHNAAPAAIFQEVLPDAVYQAYATAGALIDKKPVRLIVVTDITADHPGTGSEEPT